MRLVLAVLIISTTSSLAAADPGAGESAPRHGLTIEVNGGAGVFAIGTDRGVTSTDPVPLAVHVAVGGFVTPAFAISGQVTTTTGLHDQEGSGQQQTFTAMQLGPAAQLWLAPFAWVGAGVGLARLSYMDASVSAFGIDARAGIALPTRTRNSWALLVQGTTTVGADHDWVSAALMLGYQYL